MINAVRTTLEQRYEAMQEILRSLGRVAVAFSAGVDSTFVLKAAIETLGPENVVAVTGKSDSLARAEFEQAVQLAESFGAEHVLLDTKEFEDPNYLANPENRCYFCKSELFGKLDGFLKQRGLKAVVSGANADDLGDWRPGLRAGREHGVHNPC